MLCMNSNLVTNSISALRSGTNNNVPNVRTIPSCAIKTHWRLAPYLGMFTASTTGPQIHLKVHGSATVANNMATSPIATPLSTRYAAKVTLANPHGRPWAK